MSFSGDVKRELLSAITGGSQTESGQREESLPCCRHALTYGLLQMGHAFTGSSISLRTEYEDIAVLYARVLEVECGIKAVPRKEGRGFTVIVETAEERIRVLEHFGHRAGEVGVRLNRANFDCDICCVAYLRGAFLAGGAVTNPESGYHLEFDIPYYNLSRDLLVLLNEMDLPGKVIRRSGRQIVYFKDSERIEDCLICMGAQQAALVLMNIKLLRDVRGRANRIANCENANIDKTVTAAVTQMAALRRLDINALPDDLREVAVLRLEQPELSLRELGEVLTPPLSRSGVNHRLQRLMELAGKEQ